MSAPHNPRIVQRAKEMWTEEGLSPQQSIDQLKYEVDNNLLNVPKGTDVPADKSSINRWADKDKWEPHWRDALAARNEPASKEEMSVVEQVLYHLAENRGFNKARDYAYDEEFRSKPTEAVLMAIQMDLGQEYNPPPVVYRALRSKLRARIRQEKNAYAKMQAESNEYRERNPPGLLEIWAEALAKGLPIDDGHAGLDIVYTNQEEGDKP